LVTGATLLAAGLVIGPAGERIVESARRAMISSFTAGATALGDPAAAMDWLRWIGIVAVSGFVPFAVSVGGIALLVGAGQARGTWSTKAIEFRWVRMSPAENLKRYLSAQPVVDLIKAMSKMLIVGLVIYFALFGTSDDFARLSQSDPPAIVGSIRAQLTRLFLAAGLAMLALGVADYGYQAWKHQRDLRMTKDEVKRELRETEGDPLVRARLRSLGRALARSRMMAAVPTADVVVTNPTHIAVALRYDPAVAEAPVVVAMGARKLAERIRRIALDSGVPVIENRSVARALFATTKVGRPIPPALYYAVAEILAFVFRHRRSSPVGVDTRA
jgi:flagellar biosynthetic protein FlhB